MLTESSEAVLARPGGCKWVWHKQLIIMVTRSISLILRTEILLNKITLIPSRYLRKHFNCKFRQKRHLTSITGKFWKNSYKRTNLHVISISGKRS